MVLLISSAALMGGATMLAIWHMCHGRSLAALAAVCVVWIARRI